MQDKASVFLAEGIVIASALILVAVLAVVLSPMLWTDHLVTYPAPPVNGCSIQPTSNPAIFIAHCPFWTKS
jgi:hypothetical protein